MIGVGGGDGARRQGRLLIERNAAKGKVNVEVVEVTGLIPALEVVEGAGAGC